MVIRRLPDFHYFSLVSWEPNELGEVECLGQSDKVELAFDIILDPTQVATPLVLREPWLAYPTLNGKRHKLLTRHGSEWRSVPSFIRVNSAKPQSRFLSFQEEKEYYRVYPTGVERAFAWGELSGGVESGIVGVVTRLNRLPFTYTCGWSCSDLPSDHKGGYGHSTERGANVVFRGDNDDDRLLRLFRLFKELGVTAELVSPLEFSYKGGVRRRIIIGTPVSPDVPERYEEMLTSRIGVVEEQMDRLFPELLA